MRKCEVMVCVVDRPRTIDAYEQTGLSHKIKTLIESHHEREGSSEGWWSGLMRDASSTQMEEGVGRIVEVGR